MHSPLRRSLVFVGLAAAGVLLIPSIAAGHVAVARTNLSIHVRGGPVDSGDLVTITGRLTGSPSCRAGQEIHLFEVPGGEVASTTTDSSGRYSFTVTAEQDAAYQTRFDGSTSGVHPHSHVCAASTSRVVRVKVRGGAGADVLGSGGTVDSDAVGAADGGTTAFTGTEAWPFVSIGVALLLVGGIAAAVGHRSRRAKHLQT